MLKYKPYLLLIIFAYSINWVAAQKTKITGKIIDSETKEPIPFANIAFKNTAIGTISDFNGHFKIEAQTKIDTIVISCVGYEKKSIKVKRNTFQDLNIQLKSNNIQLDEVVFVAEKRKKWVNPAHRFLDSIWANKDKNNYDKLQSYEYELYNKVEFDLNNITEEFKNKRVFRKFQFIFDYVDTSIVNKTAYLPVFIIESLSDFYYRESPKKEKEIIKATQVSGIENESIQQFLGNMYQKFNIYDNHIDIFGKGFVSPIANFGKVFYKYYLVDSAFIDNNWCYQIVFQPRLKQEYMFNGHFWVADTSFAIKKIDLDIVPDVNLNFINNVSIKQAFGKVDNQAWMLTREELVVDFNVFENPNHAVGFFGKKTSIYKNHIVNNPKSKDFYADVNNIIVKDDAMDKDDSYWEHNRHEKLSEKEQAIYNMVDTIQSLPIYKTYVDVITTIVSGYYVWKKFEFGPYFKTYSFNEIEGHRFRIGGRTSNDFSTNLMLDGYLAYGTKDEVFKYGLGFLYLFDKDPRKGISAEYKDDLQQFGKSDNAYSEDNILGSILRRQPNDKLSRVKGFQVTYEHEWFHGFSHKITFKNRDIYPMINQQFNFIDGKKNYITTSEIIFYTRFAYNEKFVMGEFERVSLGTYSPIVDIYYTFGFKNFLNSDYNYHKLELNIKDWFNTYPFGYSRYWIQTGWIFSQLPYVLLKLHEGNETWTYDKYAFNMMNYYEFVSDRYISASYSHYFEGFFLNKIPVFKRLKWREVLWAKGVIGDISQKNLNYAQFPNNLFDINKPYFEAGAGIENIFKLFRVDAVWRLSHLDNPNVSPFGIRGSMQIKF